MPRGPIQRIQDSVHGLMEFHGMEGLVVEMLRTREVQRLRRVRQLGLAHLVFPGAEHSRLVHSLGAAHLAIRFARQLQLSSRNFLIDIFTPNESAVRDIGVAALCHDLGHGPLSHVWEREVIGEAFDRAKWCASFELDPNQHRGLAWHELVVQAILSWQDGKLHKLLETYEEGFSSRMRALLKGSYYLEYLPRLLAGDIDVDRADFLKRDTRQTGVAYGQYDLDWLVSTSVVGKGPNDAFVLGFDFRKSPRVIEQFLIARRALYETVYNHKTVHAAEGMVGLLLRRLKEVVNETPSLKNIEFVRPLVKMVSGEAVTVEEFLSVDDYSLWVLIEHVANLDGADVTARDLAKRLVERNLFKQVPCTHNSVSSFLRRPKAYEEIYSKIQPYCPGHAPFYLIRDELKFSMLEKDPAKWCYFVDLDTEDRKAAPIKEHEYFRQYWDKEEEEVRLFTLEEARDDVAKLIG